MERHPWHEKRAMASKSTLRRRTFLNGRGTSMALTRLKATMPAPLPAAVDATTDPFPTRLAFVYVPNGVNVKGWTPSAEGADFKLPFILDPLRSHQDRIQILSGLAQGRSQWRWRR